MIVEAQIIVVCMILFVFARIAGFIISVEDDS
jgi:hypothetical protein